MVIYEKVYLNRDNTIDMGLLEDGEPVDAGTLTRAILKMTEQSTGAAVSFDSVADPGVFDFSSVGQVGDSRNVGYLRIDLSGESASLSGGEVYDATLIVFDGANPSGVVWGDMVIEVFNV